MYEQKHSEANNVQQDMEVEAARGDLGEEDLSKPQVKKVVRGPDGNVEKIVIHKGALFQKELVIPADRIQRVERPANGETNGKVIIDSNEQELESLKAVGKETLPPEDVIQLEKEDQDLLDKTAENIPTTEALREMEIGSLLQPEDEQLVEEEAKPEPQREKSVNPWLQLLGPGFLAGMAGNDSSAVATYSIDGAQNGFGHLWLLLLSTFMYQAVQYTCAKLGRITQKGLAEVLHEHYGRWVAALAALVLVIANIALIAADLVAVGSGFELLTHIHWVWFILPVAALVWYFTVYRSFEMFKKIFIAMSLAFVTYIVTALIARPNWPSILFNTFVPHLNFSFASISSAVALLGATISPYNIFWQVEGEKEEKRPGTRKRQIRFASFDIAVGVVSGNLVAYFIIITSATTLFTHHKNISTAADAAQALTSVLGPFAGYLFAIGLIGAGLIAIPVLLASTSYAVSGTVGWPMGLAKKPWQNEGFYLIITTALIISLVMALLGIDPIKLIFWANVLSGVLAPILVIFLVILGNNRKIMHDQRLSWITNLGLILTAIVMIAAAILLFYGLATGQSS
jgi:NRAMP (natural resistance-associated macrophage protein)-like metal ion transporter